MQIDETIKNAALKSWRQTTIAELSKYENLNYFDLAEDLDSTLCIRIKHIDAGKQWFNKAELGKIFKALTVDLSAKFG